MTVGPAIAGVAVANADLLGGVGPDIDVLGTDVLGGAEKKSHITTARDQGLPEVSTAPSTRNVVVRTRLPAAQVAPKIVPADSSMPVMAPAVALGTPIVDAVPAAPAPAAPPIPAAVPLSVSGLFPAAPVIRPPGPEAVPIPTTIEPGPGRQIAPADSLPPLAEIPKSFRVGYADYLRAATTSDLFFEAIPGVAGIAGFTLIGAFAGYRQARAVQAALLSPAPTRILL